MNKKFKLKQTKQCKTCPFIKGSNPFDIPNGYSVELHKDLDKTIADEDNPLDSLRQGQLKAMSCHYSKQNEENYCIGWLDNQLKATNLLLRIKMLNCENLSKIKTINEQHKTFQETLPKQENE